MSTQPKIGPATYADIEALPEHKVGEIIDGMLEVSPRPAPRHALAASEMTTDMGGAFGRGRGGPGGWWILFEPELHLGRDVLVPDLAGWRKERMPGLPETAYFPLAPDWVCELLSPSTARLDRIRKMRIYAREKVPHVWLVDPTARYVEVWKLSGDEYSLIGDYGDDEFIQAEPFEAVAFDLLPWWGMTREPAQGE